jgi:AmiR/NasT family two-component response regulator
MVVRQRLPGGRENPTLAVGSTVTLWFVEALRVVADDQVLLREGLVRLLRESGLDVVAQVGDAVDLLRKVGAHHPHAGVVDIQMPPDLSEQT